MKKTGIIVAIELSAIQKLYPDIKKLPSPKGFEVFEVERQGYTVYVLKCGMGIAAAAAGVQYLISKLGVEMIVNFGVVGGLTSDMQMQKVCLVNRVVHYKYDCSEFLNLAVGQVEGRDSVFIPLDKELIDSTLAEADLPLVTCCSGDKFVGTAEEKTYLHNTFEGDICDMEAAGIVLTCDANEVPCVLFKAVSDGLSDGAEGFFAELETASLKCLEVADKVMQKIALL